MEDDLLNKELNILFKKIKTSLDSLETIPHCDQFLNIINSSHYLITLHDVEYYRPLCLNNSFKEFYGFKKNRLKGQDYLYYIKLMHASTLHTLMESFVFFNSGGQGVLELDYKLRYKSTSWKNVKGVTKTIYRNKKGHPKYAITLAAYDHESSADSILQRIEKLTRREKEIIRLLSTGRTQKEIATCYNISYNTVHSHVKNIYKKLDITKVSGLVSLIEKYPLI